MLVLALGPVAARTATQATVSPKALRIEVERDEHLLRGWLKDLPPGSGVVMVREEHELLLRFPLNMVFEPEAATILDDGPQSLPLTATGRLLKRRKQLSARIVVYSDNIGGSGLNQSLTDQRARVLADLLQKQGISAQRLSPEGAGSVQPIVSNDTPEGRIENRRVEIRLRRG
jgi:outer membrane protein OmpA-like peptidoglycan-associated protein